MYSFAPNCRRVKLQTFNFPPGAIQLGTKSIYVYMYVMIAASSQMNAVSIFVHWILLMPMSS